MGVAGAREIPISEAAHSLPVHPGLLATAPQRCSPEPDDLVAEGGHLVDVAGHRVVREMSAHDRTQPASLFLDGSVAASHQRGLDLLELGGLAFLDRSTPDREMPVPPLRAVVREAEEAERLGATEATLGPLLEGEPPEADQTRFLGVERKPESGQALLQSTRSGPRLPGRNGGAGGVVMECGAAARGRGEARSGRRCGGRAAGAFAV
jgi:hypothetical protein